MKPASCHPGKKHYSRGLCEACYMREFRRNRPEYRRYMSHYLREWWQRNKHKRGEYSKRRLSDPLCIERDKRTKWRSEIKRKFGITPDEYYVLWCAQDSKCLICQVKTHRLLVDHNHSTGEIRGLLCSCCNSGLGFFKDDPEIITRAAEYLHTGSAAKTELLGRK